MLTNEMLLNIVLKPTVFFGMPLFKKKINGRHSSRFRNILANSYRAWALNTVVWGLHGFTMHWRGIWRFVYAQVLHLSSMDFKPVLFSCFMFAGKVVRSPYGVVHGKGSLVHYDEKLDGTLFYDIPKYDPF